MVMQLGQMHIATAFVMPDALDNVEEEWGGEERVQPTDRQVKSCLPHPVTAVGLRHQEFVCGTRTGFHSTVGICSTVCAKGPSHLPTKLQPAEYFRCLSPPKAGRGTKSTSAGREPASTRW
ncbi:uncharacterized protein LOC144083064 isoform X2 [Stigmatopora argus]